MPCARVNSIRPVEVGDALVFETLQLVREVQDPVGQAVRQAASQNPPFRPLAPNDDGLRLEHDDPERRVRVGQRDRRPQPGEPAADDDDVGRRVARPAAARSVGPGSRSQ